MYENIILISLDTLRSDCINTNPIKLWPDQYDTTVTLKDTVLDDIARNGIFFPNCISAAPYTSTSHATYFTGKWPLRHGLYEFFNRKLRSKTIFNYAQKSGFTTSFKVDFPIILGKYLGFTNGIDKYIIENDDEFIQSIEPGKKNFGFAHFGGLHMPYGFHNLHYGGQEYIDTVNRLESEIDVEKENLADQLVETYRSPRDLEMLLRYKRVVQYHYSRKNYNKLFSLYLEGINFFMENRFKPFIEKLLDKLKSTNYLLVIFSDHGEEYDALSYGHHNSLSEGVIRVPIIFYGPGIPSKICLNRIRSIDAAPTILKTMGAHSHGKLNMDGHSLFNTVFDNGDYPVRPAFAQTYTSELKEYVDFQKRLLKSGKKTGTLRHILFKEVIYDNHYKMSRRHYQYREKGGIYGLESCPAIVTLEEMDHAYQWHNCANEEIKNQLSSKLDSYNQLLVKTSKPVNITDDIRSGLKSLGYNI